MANEVAHMRMLVTCSVSGNIFPGDYRPAFISLIKAGLTRLNNSDYLREIFPEGAPQKKPYTFSVGMPRGTVWTGDHFTLGEKGIVTILLSSGDIRIFLILCSAFRALENYAHPLKGGSVLRVIQIVPVREQKIFGDTILVNFLSPLCIREHTRDCEVYYANDYPGFENLAGEVVKGQFAHKGRFARQDPDSFQIVPFRMKKTVVRHYGQKIACSLGTAVLCGEPEFLTELYQNGIGSRCSSGFGLFEILQM